MIGQYVKVTEDRFITRPTRNIRGSYGQVLEQKKALYSHPGDRIFIVAISGQHGSHKCELSESALQLVSEEEFEISQVMQT